MKRFHWQLFALSMLSFSVSIENFGFNAIVFVKNVLLNVKCLKCMLVIHVLKTSQVNIAKKNVCLIFGPSFR